MPQSLDLGPSFALDATDAGFRQNPHRTLDQLRIDDPVHQDRVFDRVVLTRAADVQDVLADRSLSVDPFKARPSAFGRLGLSEAERGRHSMVFLDDPDHARLRGLVTQAFNARAVEAMRLRVEAVAKGLLNAVDSSRSFELVAAFAAPLPILVIAEMLGIDEARIDRFKRWSDETKLFFHPKRTEEQHRILWEAITGLNDSLANAVAERRQRPKADLISRLVAAEADGDRLNDQEIVDTCRAILVAGNITTTDLIGTGIVSLLQHPEQLAALRRDPDLWPRAVEEMLRHDAPITSWNRQVLDDRSIGGCPVQAGQTVTSMLAAANHDPALHTNAHAFDIHRDAQKHFSFGGGPHFCLGAALARMEARIALTTLVGCYPALALDTSMMLKRKMQPGFSGYEAIWLVER